MPITLHQYILEDIARDIANVRSVTNNENWPAQPSEIENWHEMRPATDEEKAAIASFTDLELEATQLALQKVGEPLLTPQEAKSFWQAKYNSDLHSERLDKAVKLHAKRQYRAEHFAYPNLYKKALLDDMVAHRISSWHSHNHWEAVKAQRG